MAEIQEGSKVARGESGPPTDEQLDARVMEIEAELHERLQTVGTSVAANEAAKALARVEADRDAWRRDAEWEQGVAEGLMAALHDLLRNIGGHNHWREGGAGGVCQVCEIQSAAVSRAYDVLSTEAAHRPLTPEPSSESRSGVVCRPTEGET